ncbi:hypothetical protein AB685_08080 [Bacillus sp. LL01]|nr:hypothetical protein AB685_08080 [Bacillus sp. LL01]
MAALTNKLVPYMKNRYEGLKAYQMDWNWDNTKIFMNAYGIRLIILTCLTPLLTVIPALTFKLATGSHSLIGYILSFILLVPWLLIPTLFIQHMTSHSRMGKVISYSFLCLLILTFILWIILIRF